MEFDHVSQTLCSDISLLSNGTTTAALKMSLHVKWMKLRKIRFNYSSDLEKLLYN